MRASEGAGFPVRVGGKFLRWAVALAMAAALMPMALAVSSIAGFGWGTAYAADAELQTSSMKNPKTTCYNTVEGDEDYTTIGVGDNPYRILVGKGSYCQPSSFWANGANAASGGGTGIPDMVVSFENRAGNEKTGTLLTQYLFDTSRKNTGHLNATWEYAFRLGPYVETDTSTGYLRFATASKGAFDFYFPDFEFKLNAVELTKDLASGQKVATGDYVKVTYYGGYLESQTSRGTNYTINFATEDANTTYSKVIRVGSDGMAVLRPLPTGGNYRVEKMDPSTALETMLRDEIAFASGLLGVTSTSIDGSDVSSETYWVADSTYSAYETAVASAEAVLVKDDATQEEIDAAIGALSAATISFSNERVLGLLDKSLLGAQIDIANELLDGTQVSVDGSDVSVLEYWVLQQDADSFASAIRAAQAVYDEGSTAEAVGEATANLQTATGVFESARRSGALDVVQYSYNIGTPVATGVVAEFYTNGTLVIGGTGNCKAYTSNSSIPWRNVAGQIKSVKFEEGVAPTNLSYYFYGCTNLATVEGIPGTVANMSRTFFGCSSLETAPSIPESATNLSAAFQDCTSLIAAPSIPGKVENMSYAFQGCTSLKTPSSVPDGVTAMNYAYKDCTSLAVAPDIPGSVKTMPNAFENCSALTKGPVISEGVTSLLSAFKGCTSLTEASAVPSTVTVCNNMCAGCTSLVEAPVLGSAVTSLDGTFSGCTKLEVAPDIPGSVTSLSNAFANCTSLVNPPALPATVARLTMNSTFAGCSSLAAMPSIPAGTTSLSYAFQNCVSLTEVTGIPASATTLTYMFDGCSRLAIIDEGVALSPSANASYLFKNCFSLVTIPDDFALSAKTKTKMFVVGSPYDSGSLLDTYAAASADSTVLDFDWASCNRNLVVLSAGNASIASINKLNSQALESDSLLSSVVPSEDGKDLVDGAGYVNPALKQSLEEKVAQARVLLDDPSSTTQSQVDEALTALSLAFDAVRDNVRIATIDLSPLQTAIDAGRARLGGMPASVDGRELVPGVEWSTEESINAYALALAAAQAPFSDAAATQNSIDAALASLGEAATAFEASVQVAIADTGELDALISSARNLKGSVASSVDGNDVAAGKAWATERQLSDFEDAIAAAEAIAGKTDVPQSGIDAAKAALEAAKGAFELTVSTAEPSIVALSAAVSTARAATGGVLVDADGRGVANGSRWCTQSDMDALNAAVADARMIADAVEEALGRGGAATADPVTQNDVDAALAELQAATELFDASVRIAVVSTGEIDDALEAARALIYSVTASADGSDVPVGEDWATQASIDLLQNAVEAQAAVAANAAATQNEVDAAQRALDAAMESFKASASTSDPSADELSAAVAAGDRDLSTVSVSADGSDVPSSGRWVTQGQADAYGSALAEARAAMGDALRTQNSLDAALADLDAAASAFDGAKRAGLRVDGLGSTEDGPEPVGEASAVPVKLADGKTVLASTGDSMPLYPIAGLSIVLAGFFAMVLARQRIRS